MNKRLFIIGTMGSGKTTLAKKLSKKLGIKYYSLDDFYWTTKYTRKRSPFVRDKMIKKAIQKESWIFEGVFSSWVSSIAKKADLVIWLDLDPKVLKRNILKRFVKIKLAGKEKERGKFSDVWKTAVHAKKYRTGKHKNSYQGHLKMLKKSKANYIRIGNKKDLRKFILTI